MQELAAIYRATSYVVEDNEVRFTIRLDAPNPELGRFLDDNCIEAWAFLTAHNPRSRPLSNVENQSRQDQLVKLLESSGYQYLQGYGVGDDPAWEPEPSLFVLNIDRSAAVRLGKRFQQNAILWGTSGDAVELVWCDGSKSE